MIKRHGICQEEEEEVIWVTRHVISDYDICNLKCPSMSYWENRICRADVVVGDVKFCKWV